MPSSPSNTLRPAVVLAAAALLTACGDGRVPWRAEMTRWFNNASVTPTEPDPRDWSRGEWDFLLRRVGFADVAALGAMEGVMTFAELTSAREIGLTFRPIEVLHGSLSGVTDEDGALVLTLKPGALDFNNALEAAERVPGRRFLLFLKERPQRRARPPAGWEGSLWQPPVLEKRYAWALYRPEPLLLTRVRTMYAWLAHR